MVQGTEVAQIDEVATNAVPQTGDEIQSAGVDSMATRDENVMANANLPALNVGGMQNAIEVNDSIVAEPEPVYALILSNPDSPQAQALHNDTDPGISYILVALFLLFLVIALRFRNNIKYALTMLRNLMETRTRQNIFNDTVRETSLIVLLNVMWCVSAGIIGFSFYTYMEGAHTLRLSHPSIGMLIGIAIATAYTLFMWGAYSGVGWVFSDREHAELWVKGFSASQALMAPAFFLTSLVAICQPESAQGVATAAVMVFFLGKLMFIWKGYRIFFSQFSSWVLFLCYLCSLEIVPLILSYRIALKIGALV